MTERQRCARCGCKLNVYRLDEKVYCHDCFITIEMENNGELEELEYD